MYEAPLSSKNQTAFLGSSTKVIHANIRNKRSFSHIICKEIVNTVNVVMYFSKNFYLVEAIDEKIGHFLASGIVEYIIKKYVDMKYWRLNNQLDIRQEPKKLTLHHLEGVFVIWSILCVLSVLIFSMEVVGSLAKKIIMRFVAQWIVF